jgi:hypothetical protein
MPVIEFTDNHEDLSTDQGFQFSPGANFCGECGAKQGEA